MLGRIVLVIIETLKYLKIFIFILANVYKLLSFEFAVSRKFVIRYFLFCVRIIASSSGFAMWYSRNTMVRLLTFIKIQKSLAVKQQHKPNLTSFCRHICSHDGFVVQSHLQCIR